MLSRASAAVAMFALSSFAAHQELAVLRYRRVLDQGEDCRRQPALGTVDVRRSTRLVHRIHRRFPTNRQIHPGFRLLATECRPERMILCFQRCDVSVIPSLTLGVSFATGRTRTIFFPKDGIVHSVRERLMLQVLRVQSLRQSEFVGTRGDF